MPPKATLSMLFHPKKGAKKESPAPSPRKLSTPRLKPTPEAEEDDFKLPEGPYQEFRLMSSALNGWKYDVMKFDSRKPVDISTWHAPIKLNRKELRKDDPSAAGDPVPVGPMLGVDGKPVIGADGNMVMVDSDGRPIHSHSGDGAVGKGKGPAANGKKKPMQKKTRQVYIVPDEVRRLRREERYPWVLEDVTGSETWIGQLEDTSKSETHAFFMPAANDIFKFVPAHRWYKFQKRLKHDLPTDTAGVESAVRAVVALVLCRNFTNARVLVHSEPEAGSSGLAVESQWQRSFGSNCCHVQSRIRRTSALWKQFPCLQCGAELRTRWAEAQNSG